MVVEGAHHAIGADGHVNVLVHQEVVPRSLPDDPEVVYERASLTDLEGEPVLRDPGALILGARRQPNARNALRVAMGLDVEATAAVEGQVKYIVQLAAQRNQFAHAPVCAGNEESQIDGEPGALGLRRSGEARPLWRSVVNSSGLRLTCGNKANDHRSEHHRRARGHDTPPRAPGRSQVAARKWDLLEVR